MFLKAGQLRHASQYDRFDVFLDRVLVNFNDYHLAADLQWTGLLVSHKLLDVTVQIDYRIKIFGSDLCKARKLLSGPYFIVMHICDEKDENIEMLLLKNVLGQPTSLSTLGLYPGHQLQQMQ